MFCKHLKVLYKMISYHFYVELHRKWKYNEVKFKLTLKIFYSMFWGHNDFT